MVSIIITYLLLLRPEFQMFMCWNFILKCSPGSPVSAVGVCGVFTGESPRSDTCSDQGIPRVRRRQEKTTPTPTQAGVWSHSAASMYTGMRMENRRSAEALEAAALRQQRRLKQAIRFIHRDSADLLPLDGLKKLGTSQQGVSLVSHS